MDEARWLRVLRGEVAVRQLASGELVVESPRERLVVERPTREMAALLAKLAGDGVAVAGTGAADGDGPAGGPAERLLRQLDHRLLTCDRLDWEAFELRLLPLTADFRLPPALEVAAGEQVLSRFTYARWREGRLLLENPAGEARLVLAGPAAAPLVAAFARPRRLPDPGLAVPGVSAAQAAFFARLLAHLGFLAPVAGPGAVPPAEAEALAQWQLHDLLFHVRSRRGRSDRPYGGTYRFRARFEPAPALRPPHDRGGEVFDLEAPDLARVRQRDPPLTAVLEERRSLRRQGEAPIDARQLGELLYRTARVRTLFTAQGETHTGRPYPSGSRYALELYPVVGRCRGLQPGLYHYRPDSHRLEGLPAPADAVRQLLAEAGRDTGQDGAPQVLLVLAARFQRASWKYESLAYALILKDAGVLMQTIYLVGTAMGLAVCAVGGGDSELFCRAAGTDRWTEASVGELILGSRAG